MLPAYSGGRERFENKTSLQLNSSGTIRNWGFADGARALIYSRVTRLRLMENWVRMEQTCALTLSFKHIYATVNVSLTLAAHSLTQITYFRINTSNEALSGSVLGRIGNKLLSNRLIELKL